jgi:hypothetical protein
MMRHVVGAAMLLAAFVTRGPCEEGSGIPDAKTIARWTEQLNADRYEVRESATQELIKAGAAAIQPVCHAVQSGSWEVTTRGVFVLQELSLARDIATEQAALAALERLSATRGTQPARRAAEALSKLDHLRRKRAVDIFTRLGATFNPEHLERDMVAVPLCTLEIGPEWHGDESDLRRLKWLSDVQQVTFVGEKVRDSWLAHLRGMENLVVLKVKQAAVSDAAFADLKEVETLSAVKLLYLPIGDKTAEYLSQCPRLKRAKLIGSKIGPAGEQKLAAAIGADNVDCRRGAFLGITPSAPGQSWFITSVSENSAAEQAGLIPGDVIIAYGDQPVTDFETLTKLISQNNVGDTVTIQIQRDGKTLQKLIKFGAWD